MFARTDRRGMMLALAIAVALVAVAIPTCQMVACSMNMSGGMMRVFTTTGAQISAACDGKWLATSSPLGVISTELFTLLLALLAALVASKLLSSPQPSLRRVRIDDANAPPPPREPRGERYLL